MQTFPISESIEFQFYSTMHSRIHYQQMQYQLMMRNAFMPFGDGNKPSGQEDGDTLTVLDMTESLDYRRYQCKDSCERQNKIVQEFKYQFAMPIYFWDMMKPPYKLPFQVTCTCGEQHTVSQSSTSSTMSSTRSIEPTNTNDSSNNDKNNNGSELSPGVIAGITGGAAVGAILLVAGAALGLKHWKERQGRGYSTVPANTETFYSAATQ
jgi:hypothetical protein